ncbi:MAG: DUF4168 domain-containing protein [Acidiferrobacter sp.]
MELARTAIRFAITITIGLASVSAYAHSRAMTPPQAAPPAAMPQINHTTLRHFAVAIQHVAKIRTAYIKKLPTMRAHPAALRSIQAKAQESMVSAIKAQKLTLPQYNNLVHQVDADPALRARVLHMLHR